MNKPEMLQALRDYYKLRRNADFAKHFGLSEQNAYSWQKRGTFDSETVYRCCPEVSSDWILSGEGPMLRSERENAGQSKISAQTTCGGTVDGMLSTVSATLAALQKEQDIAKEAQKQVTAVLDILKGLTISNVNSVEKQ